MTGGRAEARTEQGLGTARKDSSLGLDPSAPQGLQDIRDVNMTDVLVTVDVETSGLDPQVGTENPGDGAAERGEALINQGDPSGGVTGPEEEASL